MHLALNAGRQFCKVLKIKCFSLPSKTNKKKINDNAKIKFY